MSIIALVQLLPISFELIPLALGFGLLGVSRRIQSKPKQVLGNSPPKMRLAARRLLFAVGVVLLLVGGSLLVTDDMWVPTEMVTVEGRGLVRGYVIGSEGGWTTLLSDENREIIVARDSQIIERQPCRTSGQRSRRTLAAILFSESNRADYQRCV